jgi:hypothetical protein
MSDQSIATSQLAGQFLALMIDEPRAIEAIPAMLDRDPGPRFRMTNSLRRMIDVVGTKVEFTRIRRAEITQLLHINGERKGAVRPSRKLPQLQADESPTIKEGLQ